MLRTIDIYGFVGEEGDFSNEEEAEINSQSMELQIQRRKHYRRRRFWKGAEEILQAEYLQKMGIVSRNGVRFSIRGICLQVSNVNNSPHVIDFAFENVDSDVIIRGGKCSCAAGANGKCKHAVALLLALETIAEKDLEVWSSTNDACYWKKPVQSFQQKLSIAVPSRNFCHPDPENRRDINYPCIEKSEFEKSMEYSLILSGFSDSSAFVKHIVGRNTTVTNSEDCLEPLTPLDVSFIEHIFSEPVNCVRFSEENLYWKLHSLEQSLINFYYDNVSITSKDMAIVMYRKSKLQDGSPHWFIYRKVRITGSIAKDLYTYSSNRQPNWERKCRMTFDSKFEGNQYTQAGKKGEVSAINILEETYGKANVLRDPGFVVSLKFPWLGYSPDAIVVENGEFVLMECKTKKLGKDFEGVEFLKKLDCLATDPSGFRLKKKGNTYYCQIQLGLYVCNLKRALLVLYNQKSKSNLYINVDFDTDYVNDLLHSLANTYFNHCLPYFYGEHNKCVE